MNRALPTVRLRVPDHEDAVTRHRLFDDPEVMEFHGGVSAEPSVHEELTTRRRRPDAESGFCLWTVLDASGDAAGFTGARPWERDRGPTGEIGRRLAREHRGKGYVTAAAPRTPERVCAAGTKSVVAMVDARDTRSAAVARRLGTRLDGTFTAPDSRRAGHRYRLDL